MWLGPLEKCGCVHFALGNVAADLAFGLTLITRKSQVQILSPPLMETPGNIGFPGVSRFRLRHRSTGFVRGGTTSAKVVPSAALAITVPPASKVTVASPTESFSTPKLSAAGIGPADDGTPSVAGVASVAAGDAAVEGVVSPPQAATTSTKAKMAGKRLLGCMAQVSWYG